jgi:hypothetical protein
LGHVVRENIKSLIKIEFIGRHQAPIDHIY